MSGGAGAGGVMVPVVRYKVQWDLYSEVHCIMGNGHIGTPPPHINRQTDRHSENITFLQLHCRTVIRKLRLETPHRPQSISKLYTIY